MREFRPREQTSNPEETRRRGEMVLRALPVLLIPAFSAAVAFLVLRFSAQTPLPADAAGGQGNPVIAIIVLGVFLTALIVLVRVGRPTLSAMLLIGTWTLLTTLATLRGGITGIGPAFLIIPICAAGLLIDGAASMSLAALAMVLVGSLAWLQMQGLYVPPDRQLPMATSPFPLLALPLFAAAVWTGLYWTVALLTSLLAGGLQRALEQSHAQEQALRELSSQLEARVAEQTAELAQRAAKAEALYEISQALTSTLDLKQILALIAQQATRLLGFEAAQVLLQQPDGSFSLLGAYPGSHAHDGEDGGDGSGAPPNTDLHAAVVPLEPLLRQVSEQRRPSLVRPFSADAEVDGQGQGPLLLTAEGWDGGADVPAAAPDGCAAGTRGAALLLPMHYANRVAGVLMLTNVSGEARCSPDDLSLGQGLADQAAVAIANAQLLNQVREAATLEERTRLARDIHDTLAQGLTGVVVQLGATQRALALAPEEAREHLALALRMARESLAEARRSVWNLRAPALEGGDLGGALRALTLRRLGDGIVVTFEQRGDPRPLSSSAESTLLRVCQEALINVAKHAQASEANVVLDYQPDGVRLSIRDNGVGFDQEPGRDATDAPGPWGGFGLLGMRERVSALGGTLQISDEGGAQIVATIPVVTEVKR